MAKLIILVGNIGSSKSTYAKELTKKGFYVISRDSLRYMIGGGTYLFDSKTEPMIMAMTLSCLEIALGYGLNIVLDETNMTRKIRRQYINIAKYNDYDYEIEAHIMPKISKREAVDRRVNDGGHGTPDRSKWEEVWELFDSKYEEPKTDEGFSKIVRVK